MAGGATAPAAPHCLALRGGGVARSGLPAGSRSWQSSRSHATVAGRRLKLGMSEQGLNHANVPAALEQMGREAVAKRMQRHRLAKPRGFGGLLEQPAELPRG